MKVPYDMPLPSPPEKVDSSYVRQLMLGIVSQYSKMASIINGGLSFGNGTYPDNVKGAWYSYTTNAVANTEDTIVHGLKVVPVGWIVIVQDKAGSLYSGATAWTSSNMYLKCSVASVTVKIFILTPPN